MNFCLIFIFLKTRTQYTYLKNHYFIIILVSMYKMQLNTAHNYIFMVLQKKQGKKMENYIMESEFNNNNPPKADTKFTSTKEIQSFPNNISFSLADFKQTISILKILTLKYISQIIHPFNNIFAEIIINIFVNMYQLLQLQQHLINIVLITCELHTKFFNYNNGCSIPKQVKINLNILETPIQNYKFMAIILQVFLQYYQIYDIYIYLNLTLTKIQKI
eukprot:TRINITY_DN7891_c0_g3_i15.p1 TRINITY_DN7891_c0_g3~~TRINITY_DN7891_c0_g3_i15.p1  ORF type:complete len:218 (-),score=-17.52 TRINITY_DN7891_c0_g3_i15:549-1202(-)